MTDAPIDAASLTEKLIQAAVDYEAGRCSRRELSKARADVEVAIAGAPSDWPDHIKSHQQQVANLLNEIERLSSSEVVTANGATEPHCQTCGQTDREYLHTGRDCRDPWHGDDHLRKPR